MAKSKTIGFTSVLAEKVSESYNPPKIAEETTLSEVAKRLSPKVSEVKTTEPYKFVLRIDGEYIEQLKSIAKNNKDSLNKAINNAIKEYIMRRS